MRYFFSDFQTLWQKKICGSFRFSTEIFVHIMPVCYGLLHVARSGSVYVTMAVTIERYFAIVHPLKDFKMKKALLPLAMAFAIIYNIPKASQKSFSIVKNWLKSAGHCLKITQNGAFEIWHFPPIFVLLKLTCLVTLFDCKLQVFKNSPKWSIFGIFN